MRLKMQKLYPVWRGNLHSLYRVKFVMLRRTTNYKDFKDSLLWSLWKSKRTWPWANSRKGNMEIAVSVQTCGPVFWGVCTFQRKAHILKMLRSHMHKDSAFQDRGHSLSPFNAHITFPKASEQKGRVWLRRALAGFVFSEDRLNTLSAFIPSRLLVSVLKHLQKQKKSILALVCMWPVKILPDLLALHRWTWLS